MFESIIGFILAILILVTIHEWAHFAVARYFGIKVLRFSVGFGPSLIKRCVGPDKMEFCLASIPLGGYVKMLDTREGLVSPDEIDRAFDKKPVTQRMAVVIAGPLINIVFALFIFVGLSLTERQVLKPIVGELVSAQLSISNMPLTEGDELQFVNNRKVFSWGDAQLQLSAAALAGEALGIKFERNGVLQDVIIDVDWAGQEASDINWVTLGIKPFSPPIKPVLGQLVDNGPAQKSGLLVGDFVQEIDNEVVEDWVGLVEKVRLLPNRTVEIKIKRQGLELQFPVTLDERVVNGESIGFLGAGVAINNADFEFWTHSVRNSFIEAVFEGFYRVWDLTRLTLTAIWKMLTGNLSLSNISGPFTIAQYAGETVNAGWFSFLNFLAFLSISLGVLNLLPIPMLDGGHIMLYLIEWLRNKPLSEKVQLRFQKVGFLLLSFLMILAFTNDIIRLG